MINGCIGVRGRPADFERWEAAGAKGWGWDSVLPFYEAVDQMQPLQTWDRDQWLPVQDVLISGFQELGYRYYEDMNNPNAWDEAVGPWPQNRRNGIRQGTLVTYIRAARARPNFELRPGALVDRVLLDGTRARGVRYLTAVGQAVDISASRVVMSAGAYGSPQILLRSGIGPADELRALGIGAVADLPVGRGLMEHAYVRLFYTAPKEVSRMFGPGMPAVARGNGWYAIPVPIDEEAGICALNFILATHDGDGSLTLRSRDPAAAPVVDLNLERYASGAFDTAWRASQALTKTPTVRKSGLAVATDGLTLAEILRARMGTGAHPAGGCRIGEIVDPHLKVLGIDDLYVADASVFPRHVSNNPERTCMMIGEYAAANIRSKLAVPVYSWMIAVGNGINVSAVMPSAWTRMG
jgi:choline dehydrogenase